MALVILAVVALLALLALSAIAPWLPRAIPRILYPFYRFAGTLSLLSLGCAYLYLPHIDDAPGVIALFIIPCIAFALLAYAKFVGVVFRSKRKGVWMTLLKWHCGLNAAICFPVGLLAWACHRWYEADRVK